MNQYPSYVEPLRQALQTEFPDADITVEQVRGERFRFIVHSAHFNGQDHADRQKRVWDLTERVLAPEDLLKVSMILTVADEDYGVMVGSAAQKAD